MPKRKRYTYKEPYFIIDTDKGFLCYGIDVYYRRGGGKKVIYSLHTDKSYPHCLLKRKTKEPLERIIENMKNGTIKHPERFPNPRIIEITDSFQKFVERRHSVGIGWNVDYNIWEW